MELYIWTVSILLLLCGRINTLVSHQHSKCITGQFQVLSTTTQSFIRCQTCYMCPPGYGVLSECSEENDTVCTRCLDGYYSDTSTRSGICKPCRSCLDSNDKLEECTANSNRRCLHECERGTFMNVQSRRCESCSLCHDRVDVTTEKIDHCEAQSLPPSWTCSPNVTLTQDNDKILIIKTGNMYSYLTAQHISETGKYVSKNTLLPLEQFLSLQMEYEISTSKGNDNHLTTDIYKDGVSFPYITGDYYTLSTIHTQSALASSLTLYRSFSLHSDETTMTTHGLNTSSIHVDTEYIKQSTDTIFNDQMSIRELIMLFLIIVLIIILIGLVLCRKLQPSNEGQNTNNKPIYKRQISPKPGAISNAWTHGVNVNTTQV